ncbi:MAG TPA: TRAM domain-containing protein, partial [Alphaproteobacteria bacterium]
MPVLFDGHGNKPGQLYGRTMYNQAIHVQAAERLFGHIAQVTVTAANPAALTGEMAVNEAILRLKNF